MRNNILLVIAIMLLTITASCTQGNLGTDVGNPLPDEGDVLLPIKKHAGFCFIFELEPEMEWENVGDAKVNISDGESDVALDFADVSMEYKTPVIYTPEAMDVTDKDVLLTLAGEGFSYDESWDFPTAVMDSGSEREIIHLNPRARMAVTMVGDKSFVSNIGVSLDLSKKECLWVPESSTENKNPNLPDLEEKIPDPPSFDFRTREGPLSDVPKFRENEFNVGSFPLRRYEIKDKPEKLEIRKEYRLTPRRIGPAD